MSPSLIPVHIAVYNCKAPQTLQKYQQLASVSSARQVWSFPSTEPHSVKVTPLLVCQCRFHAYCPPPLPSSNNSADGSRNPLLSSISSLSSAGSQKAAMTQRPASGRSESRPLSASVCSRKCEIHEYHLSPSLAPPSSSLPPQVLQVISARSCPVVLVRTLPALRRRLS